MDDAVRVRFRKRISDLRSDGKRFFQFHRLSLESQIERLAFNVLHCDEAAAICFADFIDRADVWMIECRHRARFPDQALSGVFI